MNAAALRLDLLHKIEGLNATELKDIYGLLQNYFNNKDDTEEWGSLTQTQQEKITTGLAQADAGETRPLNDVMTRLRSKYRLNG